VKVCVNLTVAFLAVLVALRCNAQGTFQWTVSFDRSPLIAPGSNIGVTYYYEAGVEFRPIDPVGQFTRAGGGVSVFSENGTAYILNGLGDSFSGVGLSPRFGLVSVDLAEFSTLYPFPQTVQFLGFKPDGTSVTTEFATDGIIDGTGPLTDFQTFYFDERFADLIRFEVPGHRYALDNMVFSNVVPEPGTVTLLVLGASAVGLRFFKRKRRLP
jgi:hypothetical protein